MCGSSCRKQKEVKFSHFYIITQNILRVISFLAFAGCTKAEGRGRLSALTSGDRYVSHCAAHCIPKDDTALHNLLVQQNSLGEKVICLKNLH